MINDLTEIKMGVMGVQNPGTSKQQMKEFMEKVFNEEIMKLREAGQNEYTHNSGNAFDNFERAGAELNLDRKKVLWIFFSKHKDGVASYLNGYVSQRENVRGRINDMIVYLFLLRGMIEEDEA